MPSDPASQSDLTYSVAIVGALCTVIIVLFANRSNLPDEIFYMLVVTLSIAVLLVVALGFVKPLVGRSLSRRRQSIDRLKACRSQVEWTTDNRVEKDEWSYSPDVSYVEFSPQLNKEVVRYVDTYGSCADLFLACRYAIESESRSYAIAWLPKTHQKYPLDRMIMDKEVFVKRLANGDKVTKQWIEENFPGVYKNIITNLEEPEDAVSNFFLELNRALGANKVLNRFRVEKRKLIEMRETVKATVDSEVHRLSRWVRKT